MNSDSAEVLNERANALSRAGQLKEASALYRRAIEADPSLAKAHSNLATSLRNQGNLVDAEQSYRRAIELGGSARATTGLCTLLLTQGRADDAMAVLAPLPLEESAAIFAKLAETALPANHALRIGAAWLRMRELDPRAEVGATRAVETMTFGPSLNIVVPRSLALITPFVLKEQGDWFEDELPFVRRVLQPGEAAVDIGANFGVFTLSLAKAVGSTGSVIAYEPASATHRFLETSVRANGFEHVLAVRAAVSDHAGEATFTNASSPELSGLDVSAEEPGAWTEKVPLETLDAVESRVAGRRATFLKIDAEGEEVRILEGGRAFLARHEPLLMTELRHAGQVNETLLAKLREFGLTVYRLVPGLGVLEPLKTDLESEPFLLNVFACSARAATELAARGLLGDVARTKPAPNPAPRVSIRGGDIVIEEARIAAELFERAATGQSADERLANLYAARDLAERALDKRASIGVKCLLIRTLSALGLRALANTVARRTLTELNSRLEDLVLAPTAAYDAAFREHPSRATVELALLDYLLTRDSWSGIFHPGLVDYARRILQIDPGHARAATLVRLMAESGA